MTTSKPLSKTPFRKTESGWCELDETYGAWTRCYNFGQGLANTVVFRDGVKLSVFSPSYRTPGEAFEELEDFGRVTKIIAPNGFHTMGLSEWTERYPEATIYATPQATKRIQKVRGLARPIEDVNALAADMAGRLHIGVPNEAMREADVCAWFDVEGGAIWYVNDLVFNFPKVPPGPMGLLFRATGSAPGLRFNAMSRVFMGRNLAKTKAWFEPRLRASPPVLWVPGHGDVVAADTRAQVESLFGLS